MRIRRTEYNNISPKVQHLIDDGMRLGAAIGTWLFEGDFHSAARTGGRDAFFAVQETIFEAIDMELEHWLNEKEAEWRKKARE